MPHVTPEKVDSVVMNAQRAVSSVLNERVRQEALWGEQNHDPFTYMTILTEEVGEFAQAALQTRFGGNKGGLNKMREEAVQVAAVALAIVECLDRGKWQWSIVPIKVPTCPECGAEEIEASTPRTVYACGSSDYDRRPGTFESSHPAAGREADNG